MKAIGLLTFFLMLLTFQGEAQTVNSVPSNGNVGLGTSSPDVKLQVCGAVKIDSSLLVKDSLKVEGDIKAANDVKIDGDAYVSGKIVAGEVWTSRIRSPFADKRVYIGDSSVVIDYGHNFITTTGGSYTFQGLNVRGLAISPTSGGATTSVATATGSLSLGNYVHTHGTNAITVGKGISLASPFKNNDASTFKVGFNSDLATLTITPAAGLNTVGNVGIGTETPDAPLTVKTLSTQNYSYGIKALTNNALTKAYSVTDLSTGTPTENFLVYGNGTVYCREVFVKLGVLGDFVFDEDYNLMTYSELENYLKQNKHLPGVPAEPEVLEGGLNVGEMQAKVLQKTEENTLYILDLNKRLESSETENEKLKAELEEMKKKQAELEAKINEVLSKK